jgi:hypothetical protein
MDDDVCHVVITDPSVRHWSPVRSLGALVAMNPGLLVP